MWRTGAILTVTFLVAVSPVSAAVIGPLSPTKLGAAVDTTGPFGLNYYQPAGDTLTSQHSNSAGTSSVALLVFPVGDLPADAIVTKATLTLDVTDLTPLAAGLDTYWPMLAVSAFDGTDPGVWPSLNPIPLSPPIANSELLSQTGLITIDIPSVLLNAHDALFLNGQWGLALVQMLSEGSTSIAAVNSTAYIAPELTVEYAPAPEPASLGLLGLGALALLRRHR